MNSLRKHLQVFQMLPGNLVTQNRKKAAVIIIAMVTVSEKVLIPERRKEKRPWRGNSCNIKQEQTNKQKIALVY